MNKKNLIVVISISLLTLLVAFGLLCINTLGVHYEKQAKQANNQDLKLEYLLKSDFLKPSDQKKIEIGKIYISKNNSQAALRYFNNLQAKNREFYYFGLKAEMGDIEFTSDNSVIDGYVQFLGSGKAKMNDQSDYAAVAQFLLDDAKVEQKETYSYLYRIIAEIDQNKDLSIKEKKLAFLNKIKITQPKLVAGYLEESDLVWDKDYLKVQIEALNGLGDQGAAFSKLELALLAWPEDEEMLALGIELSGNLGRNDLKEQYQKRLDLINRL